MSVDEKLAEIELFSDLSRRELRRVASLVTPVRVEPGRVLAREGSPGREFMVISEGSATVSRNGRDLARLGPGDFFGEVALVSGEARVATVTADTSMTVNTLNRREFAAMLDESPQLAQRVLTGAVRRLYHLEAASHN